MKFRFIISAGLLVVTLTAQAQDLTKDIKIERDLNPTLRAATRLTTSPRLLQPQIQFHPLSFNENAIQAPLSASIDTLPAASPSQLIAASPYRGYAQAGYFPGYNLMVSAGYNIVNTSATTLGIWGQFDGANYKGTPVEDSDAEMHLNQNRAAVGLDLAAIFPRAGRLDINADFNWGRQSYPGMLNPGEKPLYNSATEFNATANWSARLLQMAYYAKIDYNHFSRSLDEKVAPGAPAPKQHIFGIDGGTAYFFDENSQLAGTIGARFQATSDYLLPSSGRYPLSIIDSRTLGIIDFKPAYRYGNDRLKINIGLLLQFTSHINKAINLAPDIHVYFTPASAFTIYGTLTGGKRFNTIAELYDFCPFLNPAMAFSASNIPFEGKIGFTFGPFSGFNFGIEGAYAKANQWLMPANITTTEIQEAFSLTPANLSGFQLTVKADYAFNRLLKVALAYTRAANGEKSAYYLNRDRAANILKASVVANPIQPLTLDLGFSLRSGRRQYNIIDVEANEPVMEGVDLKSVTSLDFGANYRISQPFSVFARVENILNCRADRIQGLPMQGIHGAIGAAIKF